MEKIDIIIVTFNRRNLLQRTIEGIGERTKTPYRLIVVDNHSTKDDTVEYLKVLKEDGRIDVLVLNDKNEGLAPGYNIGLEYVESELFITTNDDLIPPDLDPDWIQVMISNFEKYYPEYGALSMRCAMLKGVYFTENPRVDWLPHDEIGEARHSLSALFRIQKKSDIKRAPAQFGTQAGYRDELQYKVMMNRLGFRTGFLRDVWANHIGFALENRGFPKDFKEYAGQSDARNKKDIARGYPEIDPKTNKPLNWK